MERLDLRLNGRMRLQQRRKRGGEEDTNDQLFFCNVISWFNHLQGNVLYCAELTGLPSPVASMRDPSPIEQGE